MSHTQAKTTIEMPASQEQQDEKTKLLLEQRVHEMTRQSRIVAFIKGEASRPYCKFSKQLVQQLVSHGIVFSHVNVRDMDQELYATVKKLVNFPTFPQVYIDGELVGGLDITMEYLNDGTLFQLIDEAERKHNVVLRDHHNEQIVQEAENNQSSSWRIRIRLSNGTFVMKDFESENGEQPSFESVFAFAGESEMKLLNKSELDSFVLCMAYPFNAFDSRSLGKTLGELELKTDVVNTLMVYYPPVESTTNEGAPSSTNANQDQVTAANAKQAETSTAQNQKKEKAEEINNNKWPLVVFGVTALTLVALHLFRNK